MHRKRLTWDTHIYKVTKYSTSIIYWQSSLSQYSWNSQTEEFVEYPRKIEHSYHLMPIIQSEVQLLIVKFIQNPNYTRKSTCIPVAIEMMKYNTYISIQTN